MLDFSQTWWPPSEDEERLRCYRENLQLYDSNHKDAFAEKSAKIPAHLAEKQYLIQDYPRLVTDIYADLIYGAPPVFSLPGQQDELDKLIFDNQLPMKLYQSELTASACGEAVWKCSVAPARPGGPLRVYIEEVRPWHYFVEVDPHNCNRVISQVLAWEHVVGDGERRKRYLVIEHHYPGQVINQCLEILGHGRVRMVPVPLSTVYGEDAPDEVQDTRIPVPLVYHMPNVVRSGKKYGFSDYTEGLKSLFNEANARITAIASVLDRHIEPITVVPPGVLNRQNKGNVRIEDLQLIEVGPEMAGIDAPRKLTWDAQLTSAFNMLEQIENKILYFSAIHPLMLGKEKDAAIDSGRAMDMRFARMMARVNRKRTFREPVIQSVLYCAQMLQSAWLGLPEPSQKVEIVWRNGLPKDDLELTNVAQAQVASRLMSRASAIRYIRQVGQAEAEDELSRIRAEEQADLAPQAAQT